MQAHATRPARPSTTEKLGCWPWFGGDLGGAIACGGRPPLGQVAALAINARPLLEQVSPRRRGLLRRAMVAAGCGGGGLSCCTSGRCHHLPCSQLC